MSPIFLDPVTTFIENIWPMRYKGILIAKLINAGLMHLKKWPWKVSQVISVSVSYQSIHNMVFCRQKYPIKTFHGQNQKKFTPGYIWIS